ncbi:outer membrane receptor protein [Sphingobium sp. GW456-12-10-14-TSB1]|nr:outer membrane receptor protein [Sphingobium sp. GW456-12-10-14-TSB1]
MPTVAHAQDDRAYHFDLPAQDLGDALRSVAARAGWELYASADDINGIAAPRLEGTLTARQAIERLLAGSNLTARFTKGGVIIRGRSQAAEAVTNGNGESEIVVTGSRIRGVPPAAPVSTITSDDMRRAGQTDLGEAIRSSPLNFGGGQNPGIGTNQGSANVNVNGGSSVNLLGLGPNATLTLLNGNRMSYTGVNAAVDVSAIPAVAVDRVEIVTDGASAIYGADAVAGVVNVVLRRDYEGVTLQSRLGGATDGGGFQQQYGAIGGYHWASGGVLAAYDYLANDAILAKDRSFTTNMGSDATIYPRIGRHSVLISLNQDIGDAVSASIDLLFKDSRQDIIQGYLTGQSHFASGADARADTRSFTIAPNLSVRLGGDWTMRFVSSFASDNTRIHSNVYASNTVTSTGYRRYDNSSISAELGAEGPLIDLPAGPVRVAFGAGYRRTSIDLVAGNNGAIVTAFDRHRNNIFGYGEVHMPLLAPGQDSALGRSLALTGAFRYEHNSGVDPVAVPKLGIVYSPVTGVTLKGSWGRSFRLPALYQQYSGFSALLLPVAGYGTGYPVSATFIGLAGANPDMTAERSESWTVTAEVKPGFLPGFSLNVSYFDFDYRDKVASPVMSVVGMLNNPAYASLMTFNPSAAQQLASYSGAPMGLQNITGRPYDPADVVAIADIRERNVARQIYHGVDLSARYRLEMAGEQRLDFSFAGTWINSRQQLLEGLAFVDLAGNLFNPPRFKSRIGLIYSAPNLSLSGFANLSSGLTDRRRSTIYNIDGLSTFDLAAQVNPGSGFELGAAINNLFNHKPDVIVTGSPYETTFDSTNFSSTGRFISVFLRKSW